MANLPFQVNGALYRVLASEDGTQVTDEMGNNIGPLLNAGDYFDTPVMTVRCRLFAQDFRLSYHITHSRFLPSRIYPGQSCFPVRSSFAFCR